MKSSLIPRKENALYYIKVNKIVSVINPFSNKGLLILNKRGTDILSHINGRCSVNEIITKQKKRGDISEKCLVELLEKFEKFDLIKYENLSKQEQFSDSTEIREKILTIWFSITNQCNFRCAYCFVNKTAEIMSSETLDVSLRKIVKTAMNNGFDKIHLMLTGGEPLLEMGIIKEVKNLINKYAKQFPIQISLGMITNASLIHEENAAYLKKSGFKVAVSIDGMGKIHDSTRSYKNGKGTYEYVKRGLHIAKKFDILDNILITVTNKNLKQLPSFVKYLIENVSDEIVFGLYKDNIHSVADLKPDEKILIKTFKKIVSDIYHHNESKDVRISPFADGKINIDYVIKNYPFNPSSSICGAGNSYVTINHNGTISLCPFENMDIGFSVFSDGDLLQQVWKSRDKYYSKSDVDNHPECKLCFWKYVCAGGCRFQRRYLDPSFSKKSPYCKFYKEIIIYQLKLETQRIIKNNLTKLI